VRNKWATAALAREVDFPGAHFDFSCEGHWRDPSRKIVAGVRFS
jgi:hypothetical protein